MFLARILILSSSLLILSGCSTAPIQKAETYLSGLYRRIPYKVEGDYRAIDIFYATNRQAREKRDGSIFFKRKIADNLTYGVVTVKIDPSLTISKMLPAMFKRRGLIGMQNVEKLDDGLFIAQLKEAVNSSPHKSLFVIVSGYKDNFELTAIKTAYFAYLLDVNTPVLMFDWPGDQSVSIGGYKRARSLAKKSGPYLGDVLAKIVREVKPENLWVEGASLGCETVCDAFEYMYKHDDLADADTEITHVFLAAPDVGENEFDEQFKNEISALSKKLTTYVSSNDEALLLSSMIEGERMLGRRGLFTKKQENLEEAKDILYLKSLEPDRIALVDVTPINKASYGHGYYLESPEFFDDVYLRIFDKKPEVSRRLYLLKYKDNVDYWILRGR